MYTTELMEKILTSESGQRMIQRVTNKYGESYVGLWLFQVMGLSNDEIKAMVDDFKLQVVPQTATWSLPWWERSVGLIVDESLNIEERRQNYIEKKRQRLSMNPARIEQIISAMAGGVDVWMDEYAGKNRFAIHIYDLLAPEIISQIRKKLKKIKQSHKVFDVYYEKDVEVEQRFYVGGFAALNKKYQVARISEPQDGTAPLIQCIGGISGPRSKYQTTSIKRPSDDTIARISVYTGGFVAQKVKYQTAQIKEP